MKTKVFGLFVGIDAYNGRIVVDNMAMFPALGGCVNDVVAVRDALAADPDLDFQVKMLTDTAATKAAIVEAFDKHLGQAGADDVALFYFSGHGTVEKADPTVWTAEQDKRLEGIVCYYTENKSGKFLLSDKELRYLLAKLTTKTKAHIVAIFDCCHSGDNTRSVGDLLADGADKAVRKQVDIVFPQRAWEDFIFANELHANDFKGKGIDDVLPPGRYLQLSACESNEPALEVNGHGVLTDHLLKALKQTNGNLTYRELSSRIRNQVRYLFSQRPKIYTPNTAASLAEMGFLKKPAGTTATDANLVFNTAGEIRIDRGISHHVEPNVTTVTVTGKNGSPVEGKVKSATLDAAVVVFDSGVMANVKREPQRAKLGNLSQRLVRLHVDNRDKPNKELKTVLETLGKAENAAYFAFEDDPAKADYTLVKEHKLYYLALPSDPSRPLILPLRSNSPSLDTILAGYLRHISQWKFAEQLHNSGQNALPDSTLKIEIFDAESGAALEWKDGAVRPKLSERAVANSPQMSWRGSIKVKLTNQSAGDLYVAALYSSYDFSCNTRALLEPAVAMLESGQSKWLFDHRTNPVIPLKLDESIRLFNWKESNETVKIVFSSEQFDLSALELGGLPSPAMLFKRGGLDLEETTESSVVMQGWNARNIRLAVANPLYNTVDEAELGALIDKNPNPASSAIAHFMLGLYFEKNAAGKWQLKPGLSKRGSGQESTEAGGLAQRAEAWDGFWAQDAE